MTNVDLLRDDGRDGARLRPHLGTARRPAPEMRTVPIARLRPDELEEIWACYNKYVSCPKKSFLRNLLTADKVHLLHERAHGRVIGFVAMRLITVESGARKQDVLYGLYADIEPEFRGRNVIQRLVVKEFVRRFMRHPLRPLYVIFTASTFTSYLLLTHNLVDYWPHRDRPTPRTALDLMDKVMRQLGVSGWNPGAGVLKRSRRLRYREGVFADDRSVLNDPDVRCYAAHNPNQSAGDSLVCLFPANLRNFLCVIAKMAERRAKARRRWARCAVS